MGGSSLRPSPAASSRSRRTPSGWRWEAALNIFADLAVEEVGRARYKDNYRRRPEPHVTDRPGGRVRRRAERLSPEAARGTFDEVEMRFTDRGAPEAAQA